MNEANNGTKQADQPAFNLIQVFGTLYKWRRPILGVSFAVALFTAVVSLFLPNYFNTTTVFLAASPDQAKPEFLFNKSGLKSFIYGTENDIDRILTIAESGELINFIVDSFNLYRHYDIDSTHTKAPYKVKKKFLKYYDVLKTNRDAIELSFEDKNPVFASYVANTARDKINEIAQNLMRAQFERSIETFKLNIENKTKLMGVLADTLISLRKKYKIYNSNAQSETITAQYDVAVSKQDRLEGRLESLKEIRGIDPDTIRMLNANLSGVKREVSNLEKKIELLNDGISIVNLYEKQYLEANQSLSNDQERLKEYQAAFTANIPAVILVEKAEVPVMKSRPKRSILVIGAGFISFILLTIGVLLFEAYRDINWKEIVDGNSNS